MLSSLVVSAVVILAALTAARPSVSVYPRIVMAGSAMRVTCRVPRRAVHRWISWGIDGLGTSTRQLDGLDAPITFERLFEHVSCNTGPAVCEVTDNLGRTLVASADFEIVSCEP